MKILAIETSCDETAIALAEASGGLRAPRFKVTKNIISSQVEIHRPWGGIVPNLAKREHIKNLPTIFKRLLGNKKLKLNLLAVTIGPGLEPALWTGINFAKKIHKEHFPKARLIGVNHLEGHLYSFLLAPKSKNLFPAVALIVSGGHTTLLLMKSLTSWKKLGETRDDAVGEVFDKVARMIRLPYPGGPEIEKLATKGDENAVDFPRPMMHTKNYDFSFSGLKTSVLYYLRDHKRVRRADIAASFQQAAIDVLVEKTVRAAKEFRAKSIMLSGGVAANKILRRKLKIKSSKLKASFFVAPTKFNTDNAAMIAVAAYISHLRGGKHALRAQANLTL
ncbi:MAG: tRNA (adenosine(37)-N6)-threonylcarbamoyltransferase complex transferase subunit TsaD [Patescibacteria group bacterium]|nr:tRNA (adenosine(37)-N6)-threonylcarbamoyltransferase complex transferase subunit TsaD [Patescibacteria group bacterium]